MKKMNVWLVSGAAFLILLLAVAVFAAGTVTDTYVETMGNPRVMSLAFSNVTGTGTNSTGIVGASKSLAGEIHRVIVHPSHGDGTTNHIVMYLKDAAGIDLFYGATADMATNTTVSFSPAIILGNGPVSNAYPVPFNGQLTLWVTNSCSTNVINPCTGVVDVIYYAP